MRCRVLLQQLPLGLTEAVALPLSGRGMARHPPGDRTGILAGLVGRDGAVQLLQRRRNRERLTRRCREAWAAISVPSREPQLAVVRPSATAPSRI